MSDEARAVALDAALTRHDAVVHGGAGELRELVAIANVLRASAPMCAPSPVFRSASRARLRAAIAADPARRRRRPGAQPHRSLRSTLHGLMSSWLTRAAAGVATLSAVGVATASASAGALPSDALYPVKQAQEVFALQLAADDTARAGVLVQQADTRLDEAARLVETGRMHEAVEAAQRYDTARDRAATALEVAPSGDQLRRRVGSNGHSLPQSARIRAARRSAWRPPRAPRWLCHLAPRRPCNHPRLYRLPTPRVRSSPRRFRSKEDVRTPVRWCVLHLVRANYPRRSRLRHRQCPAEAGCQRASPTPGPAVARRRTLTQYARGRASRGRSPSVARQAVSSM